MELHPNLIAGRVVPASRTHGNFERIHVAGRDFVGLPAVEGKYAGVAGAKEIILGTAEIDGTSKMRADRVECQNGPVAHLAKPDTSDRHIGEPIPRVVDIIKYSYRHRRAIRWNGLASHFKAEKALVVLAAGTGGPRSSRSSGFLLPQNWVEKKMPLSAAGMATITVLITAVAA